MLVDGLIGEATNSGSGDVVQCKHTQAAELAKYGGDWIPLLHGTEIRAGSQV